MESKIDNLEEKVEKAEEDLEKIKAEEKDKKEKTAIITKTENGKPEKVEVTNMESGTENAKEVEKEIVASAEKSKTDITTDVEAKTVVEEVEEEVKKDEKTEIHKTEEKVSEDPVNITEEVKAKIEPKEVEKESHNQIKESDKQNLKSNEEITKTEGIIEQEIEMAEEAKETTELDGAEKENKTGTTVPEVEKQKESQLANGKTSNGDSVITDVDAKVQSNGVNESEKMKENGEPEDSIKLKKTVADGAGESDVITAPIVAATS